MINDFNDGASAWTDWNILLDENGGPNHVGNFCFAPVHADTRNGQLIYTNAYYYIGHFSKFVRNLEPAPHRRVVQPGGAADHCFREQGRQHRGHRDEHHGSADDLSIDHEGAIGRIEELAAFYRHVNH